MIDLISKENIILFLLFFFFKFYADSISFFPG